MAKFSLKSKDKLDSCNIRLQKIMNEAINIMDFTVLCGHRTEDEQNKAFEDGYSHARWGQSKHNSYPSNAVDIAPYPINWNDAESFARLAGIIQAIAYQMDIKIKWGGDFSNIKDRPHFETIED